MKTRATARATARTLAATLAAALAAALLLLAGCATTPTTPRITPTGDPITDGRASIDAAPKKDKVLHQYRLAATTLRRGAPRETKTLLDDALMTAAANYGNTNATAAKARRMFRHESDKPFIGEPYERVMANYYRAILYWRDGEPDNARALLRTASLLDSDTDEKTYAGDYILCDYLDGYATAKLGGDGSDALARAAANARAQSRPAPPPYDPSANVLLFIEFGHGPRKIATGQYGEQLRFQPAPPTATAARLEIAGRAITLPAYDDLYFQATTRGGRVMDHILGNKAVFKTGADTVGDAALMGAAIAANSRGEDARKAALALATVGLLGKLASAATTPAADTRQWDNLPRYLSFHALRLPPGDHPATLAFLDSGGRALAALTQHFTITIAAPAPPGAPPRDTIIYRSELTE
ncbi:MAG: hypothetical protein LBI02_12500 [Opitutaceae bacterium]|jgi:hypothetical protein|nr:hypothetical protein [Opitutaceae bacterium]